MKKTVLMSVLMCILLTALVSCGKQNELVKETAQIVADAFTNGDMEAINKTIFGPNKFEVDEELSDIWGESAQSQESVLIHIFDLVTVKVKKTTDSTVEFEITAPDMSKVFVDIDRNMANISEDKLLEHIKDYAKNAELKLSAISLEYILMGDTPILNYQNEEFINAITGGLLDAYKSLYSKMMEEYAKGVN